MGDHDGKFIKLSLNFWLRISFLPVNAQMDKAARLVKGGIKLITGFTAKYHTFWRFTALLLTEFLRWLKWPKNPKKDDGKPKGFSWFSTILKKRNRQFKNHSEYFLTGVQKRSTDEIYIFLWSSILAPNWPGLTHLPSTILFFWANFIFQSFKGWWFLCCTTVIPLFQIRAGVWNVP